MDTSFYLSIVVALIPVIPSLWLLLRDLRRHGILWVALPPKSMVDIADEVSEELVTTFRGRPVRNLTKFVFLLHNYGFDALDRDSIDSPLTWDGPAEILDARVVLSLPKVELQLTPESSRLSIEWTLFNPRCKAIIEVLCASGESNRGNIDGQIRNVSEIRNKEIEYIDEEEARRHSTRIKLTTPEVFRFMQSERLSMYILRNQRKVLGITFLFLIWYAFFIFVMILNSATYPSIGSIIIPIIVLTVATSLVLYVARNPYSKLLRRYSAIKASARHRRQ